MTRFADAFKKQTASSGQSWLTVESAAWNTDKQTLEDGSLYYFDAELKVTGHTVPDDFNITINGKAPVDISCESLKGAVIVSLRWEFSVGTPEKVKLSFETGNGATPPKDVSVEKGKILKYLERPYFDKNYSENGKSFVFGDWADGSGKTWENLTISGDTKLSAKWINIIDIVEITFDVPKIGDSIIDFTLPENAAYVILEYNISDEDYRAVDKITKAGYYEINLFIVAIEGESTFAVVTNEFDEPEYAGTVTVNGENCENYYYDYSTDHAHLWVGISFTVE